MFIQPCFIRKNSPELRKKLEELGYEPNAYESFWEDDNRYIITTIGSQGYGYYTLCIKNCCLLENELFIDCGTNEELFLALAALRDDTNDNQWFIAQDTMWDENYNGEITVYYEEGEWLLWGYYSFMEYMLSDFRKATVEEIIEHFKDK